MPFNVIFVMISVPPPVSLSLWTVISFIPSILFSSVSLKLRIWENIDGGGVYVARLKLGINEVTISRGGAGGGALLAATSLTIVAACVASHCRRLIVLAACTLELYTIQIDKSDTMKIAIDIIREMKKQSCVRVDETFVALLASIYPKHWNWLNSKITYIVPTQPISDKNIRFTAGESLTLDVIKQATHSLNIARKRLGKHKVLQKYADRRNDDRGLACFHRRRRTHRVHSK